ncbi:MAG TPA: SDR family NAD(P)-dependent oxidoreductase [Steroidobacteraceae bacterium]|nr:SDR family NAD(P)-dependent oxidoreductase [Steroidobacteraceae bacterium]
MRRKLAVVTGACTGIGLEVARLCARQGFELIVVADEALIHDTARELGQNGLSCTPVQCDLATAGGIASLLAVIASGERPVDYLFADGVRVIHTNIDGTVRLVFAVAAGMRSRGRGRILITGSVASLMPDAFRAVYNVSKTFLDSFAMALGNELKDTGVTVTSLIPSATESDAPEELAAAVARLGFEAMTEGRLDGLAEVANRLHVPGCKSRARPQGVPSSGTP